MCEKRIMKPKKKISSSNLNAFESKLLMNYPQIFKIIILRNSENQKNEEEYLKETKRKIGIIIINKPLLSINYYYHCFHNYKE